MKTASSDLQLTIFKNIFFLETFEVILVRHENHKTMYKPGVWLGLGIINRMRKFAQLSAQTLVVTKISFVYFAEQWEDCCAVELCSINVFVVFTHRYRKEYRKKEPLKKTWNHRCAKIQDCSICVYKKYRLHWIEPRKIVQLLLLCFTGASPEK